MTGDRFRLRLPQSLFGRTLLILFAGLLASHAIGAWIYAGAREQAVRATGGYAAAQRVANLARLIEEAPADWRPRIVAALNDPTFHVGLSRELPERLSAEPDGVAATIRDSIGDGLPDWAGRDIRVAVEGRDAEWPGRSFGRPGRGGMGEMGGMMRHMMGPGFGGFGAWRQLQAAVRLNDGHWLTFATALPQDGPPVSGRFAAALAIMGVIVLGVSAWAVRSVTTPLTTLAAAADRLGQDIAAPPLLESGTTETRTAARAFNRMQERLQRMIETRTRMLAALSHDLRTPLTLLRLRAEGMADNDEREKALATISDMDAMIGSTLAFARDEAAGEQRRIVDVAALAASVVDDMTDAGLPVQIEPASPMPYECQPAALKRAIANLLDNALKYGERARVWVARAPEAIEIVIEDEGPGIPEEEIPKVTQPFYRVDASRSRETGGAGLGLAIVQSIVQAHGGELLLANIGSGGLRATMRLPAG